MGKFDAFSGYFDGYLKEVSGQKLLPMLEDQLTSWPNFLERISEEDSLFRYAEGKWSIREIAGHINDTERIMTYRALSFARGEKQKLPGYDEDPYVAAGNFDRIPLADLSLEWQHIRKSTILFFAQLSNNELERVAYFSGTSLSVEGLAYLMAGHIGHHKKILEQRYLSALQGYA